MPDAEPLTQFERAFDQSCDAADLATAGAAALCRWLTSDRVFDARLLRCRQSSTSQAELIIAEVDIELGQRPPVNPIKSTEVIGFVFEAGNVPQAYPLRADFPQHLPHINLAPRGSPRSLCLFDLPQDELLRVLTPVLLIERTRYWLAKSAHGELHGDEQPLDPIFAGRATPVLLPLPSPGTDEQSLVAFALSDHPGRPVVVDDESRLRNTDGLLPLAYLAVETVSVPHGRLQSLPRNLGELVEIYRELGVDLAPCLASKFHAWLARPKPGETFEKSLLLIVSTPIERNPGKIGGYATKGFLFHEPASKVAEALGAVQSGGGMLAKPLVSIPADQSAMAKLVIDPTDIHRPFERNLAAIASGFALPDEPEVFVLIGAGALGSQIALAAARGGHGRWTIIDPDHLMPHNLARHALLPDHVGAPKAEALAEELRGLLGRDAASAIVSTAEEFVDTRGNDGVAGSIVDVSASVPVSRFLATSEKVKRPVISIFISPSGLDLVVLREGDQRRTRLDHLEMDYYWALATNSDLSNHLSSADSFLPTGGCRHPSVQISQSRLMKAAAVATEMLVETSDNVSGQIELFVSAAGGTKRIAVEPHSYTEFEVGGWAIAVSAEVLQMLVNARQAAAPFETGGIIVGAWDRSIKKGWLVALLDPPPDSEHSPDHFIRGSIGVFRTLSHIERTTASNLSYLGEWHTHPPGHASRPSEDDRLLMTWIGESVVYSDVPALMLIGGEDGARLFVGTTMISSKVDG